MFPITLPEYRIKARVAITYAAWNGTYLESQQVVLSEEWEPNDDSVNKLIALYVPAQWHDQVQQIMFEPDQPLNKVRYGQSVLIDGVSQVNTLEYSFTAMEYTWDKQFVRRSVRMNTAYTRGTYAEYNARLYIG